MKHTTPIFALLALSVILSLACQKESNTSQSNPNATPVSPVVTLSPSPESSPTPNEPRSGDLVKATSSGDISYQLAGVELGDSTKMNLSVRNKTERTWEVKIEVGTKLEPGDSDVQQMVVTKEVEVHLEPHDHQSIELEVSCLDISKAAPSSANTKWRLVSSQNLAQFIRCANDAVNDLKAEGDAQEEERRGLIQGALWKARGATRDDWIHYYQDYHQLTAEQAEQVIEESEPTLKKITDRCPTL